MDYSTEKTLLAACLKDKKNHTLLSGLVTDSDFSEVGKLIYKAISDYYQKDESAPSVDLDLLRTRLKRLYDAQSDIVLELLEAAVTVLDTLSSKNLLEEVYSFRVQAVKLQLASACYANGSDEDIQTASQSLNYLLDNKDKFLDREDELGDNLIYQATADAIVSDDSAHLFTPIPLLPGTLQKHTGGVLPGHHIVIFARPNTGKSLFTVNMCAGFLKNGKRVLYVMNEEPITDLYLRFLSRMTGESLTRAIFKDRDRLAQTMEEAKKVGLDNLILTGRGRTEREIRALIEQFKPDVLVVDQILNLKTGKTDSDSAHLSHASKMMRGFGKEYAIVTVSVCQAGDSASGKTILKGTDVHQSNTDVEGDADLMIGLGTNPEFLGQKRFMVNIIKNKVDLYHGYFPVEFSRELNKVTSL